MPPSTKGTKNFKEMSNEELAELQDGFIALRNHANHHLREILIEQQDRLEKNIIK